MKNNVILTAVAALVFYHIVSKRRGVAMNISQKGVDFIKKHEGLRLTEYKDQAGLSTIGYGHLNLPGS